MAIQKITADVISSDAITTASISDSAITAAKLAGTLDLTGKTITVATASSGDNDTSVASTAFVQQELASLVDSAPGTLNTLNELAAALGDDANFSTTVTNSIATKLPLAGGTMTGTLTLADIASSGYLQLTANDVDFIVRDTTDSPTNFIWRDHSGSKLYLGSPAAEVTIRSDAIIDTGYKIGIGTSSPGAPLDLETAGNTADGTYYSTFTINNTGSSTWSRIRFDRSGVAKWGLSLGTDDKFKINNLFTGGTTASPDDNALVIDNNSNVGIGTSNPQMGLHVGSGTQSTAALAGIGIANGGSSYSFYSASDGTKQYIAGIDHNITYTKAGSLSNHSHSIITNNTNAIFIDTSQNVGINESSPNAYLHVTGKASYTTANSSEVSGLGFIRLQPNSGSEHSLWIHNASNNLGISGYSNAATTSTRDITLQTYGGKVGIGTDSPDGLLHISSGTSGDAILILESDTDNNDEADNPQIWFKGDGDITKGAVRVDDNQLQIISNVSAASGINFYVGSTDNTGTTDPGTSATERMRIDSSGNVGIGSDSISGISSNATTLDIRGGVTTKGGAIRLRSSDSSVSTYLYADNTSGLSINTSTSHPMVFRTAAAERMRIDASGNLFLNTTSAMDACFVQFTDHSNGEAFLGLSSKDDNNVGIRFGVGTTRKWINYRDTSNNLIWYDNAAAAERMRIDSSGRVTMPNQPAFHAYGPSGSIADGSVVIPANTYVNTGSHYSTSNGRFTAPVAGVYLFFWSAIGNNTNDVYRWFLYKNGSATGIGGGDVHLRQDTTATGSEYATNGSRVQMVSLSANDYVYIYFDSDSGTAAYYQSDYVNFGGYLIG